MFVYNIPCGSCSEQDRVPSYRSFPCVLCRLAAAAGIPIVVVEETKSCSGCSSHWGLEGSQSALNAIWNGNYYLLLSPTHSFQFSQEPNYTHCLHKSDFAIAFCAISLIQSCFVASAQTQSQLKWIMCGQSHPHLHKTRVLETAAAAAARTHVVLAKQDRQSWNIVTSISSQIVDAPSRQRLPNTRGEIPIYSLQSDAQWTCTKQWRRWFNFIQPLTLE